MDQIYATLFDRIIKNYYPPNSWLREDALSKEFNVSRTPIRTVLRQLEQDDLLEILPKRGAKVHAFNADDLEDIYEIRRSLELIAIEKALPSLSIHSLIEIKKRIQSLASSENETDHSNIDSELHTYLIQAADSRRLTSMLDQLYRLIQTFREIGFKDPEIRENTAKEHLLLIEALCIRDLELSKNRLSDHIQNSKIRILHKVIQGSIP